MKFRPTNLILSFKFIGKIFQILFVSANVKERREYIFYHPQTLVEAKQPLNQTFPKWRVR